MEHIALTKYTNHYYIGSERIASALGTLTQLGILCEQVGDPGQALINRMDQKVDVAGNALQQDYGQLDKTLVLPPPFHYNGQRLNCDLTSFPELYSAYWYHPDHLGSSSYITNLDGEITQHMEYLPFGETLIEEHLNSNNSPYKFNAKEYDAETGNYYYGARYYDPKWSVWLSVDPLAERYPNFSPYAYVLHNPINAIDPDGLTDYKVNKTTGEINEIKNKNINNKIDRILRTDNKGDVKIKGEGFLGFLVRKSERGKEKVAIDGIADGILKDGLNLKSENNNFKVNGSNEPSLDEFNKFISEFSDYIGKEIAGVKLGEKGSENVSSVSTYFYEGNSKVESATAKSWMGQYNKKGIDGHEGSYLKGHFHTHPYNDHRPSKKDMKTKANYPNLPFSIISGGYEEPF